MGVKKLRLLRWGDEPALLWWAQCNKSPYKEEVELGRERIKDGS